MVLEHVFPEDWLEKKASYSFILGILYSFMGISLAKWLFPEDPALVAVAFTSLLLLPELYQLFSLEEVEQGKEKWFSIKELWKDNYPFVRAYLMLFFGILLAYSLASMLLPSFDVNSLFREQLELRAGHSAGEAIAVGGFFWDLIKNNIMVLIACFIVSLLTGDGAIFLVTWNASVWGTVFGVTARNAASFANSSPLVYFGITMAIVLPHVLLEGLAYITAAISGGVISKDVLLEKFDSKRFKLVFFYNFILFLLAILFLLLGAGVESWVLENSTKYKEIIQASYS